MAYKFQIDPIQNDKHVQVLGDKEKRKSVSQLLGRYNN